MNTLLLLPGSFSRDSATVEGEAYHHLFRVKRLQAGDELRVVDGRGAARAARVESVGKREARLVLGEVAPAREPDRFVELFVATPKPERAAWLVEKATELGVVAIRFVSTDREARSLSESQIARLQRIAVSAVEQCGRSVLPPVLGVGGLREAVFRTGEVNAPIAVLDASGGGARPAVDAGGRIALFVGPEGGWSAEELSFFVERALFLWALGPTVLRVETAAIVAAGIVLAG